MKKVLFSIHSLFGGGAEKVVTVWASRLAEMGYDVTVLVISREENEYPISDKVKIVTVSKTNDEYLGHSQIKRILMRRKLIKAISPDVLISFLADTQALTMLAATGLKIKRVETVRLSPWETYIGMKKPLYDRAFLKADSIIVQTEEQSEFFNGKNREKCVVIRNPISDEFLNTNCEYRENARLFVAAGRIDYQKNYPLMMNAFLKATKDISDAKLLIYGGGYETESVNNLIKELGAEDKIKLMGKTNDMKSVYESADCFLMTSDFEGMPNALMEAMAVGLPVISTDCRTGPKDMITDGITGYLAKTGDMDSVVSAISKILSMNNKERETMGKRASEDIKALCNDEENLTKLVRIIEE